ncbi:aldo/keto reductase [Tamlana sp. 2_MG-2023]|uniref:aldo/keto reductase n=1 Tax=unclassified Tamlana TaxID=2614803 RepID=UPI0026E292B7|nr:MULTISPECIES: aldo/keto reductase [unclassified Tamlana]MDO6761241.1 aldo/keto reductase [Tamlana sp. 2_MG-2023]MDO6791724.1 aldo/keto reductase [Tamlana sp. 1_MG-2023]
MKPTYITGDHTKSEFFDNQSRMVCGCSGLGGVWRPIAEKDAIDTLSYALEQGVRVFDTAPSYNRSQEFLGKTLKLWNGEKPFISTKVGRLKADRADDCIVDYTHETMRKSVYESLEVLGIDTIDLLFLHEPHLVPVERMNDIMDCLNGLKKEGVVKRLGVGGNPTESFYPHMIKENFDVLSGFLKMDACNLSGFERDIPQIQRENIAYYAASALHMGLLGRRLDQYDQERPNNEWVTNLDVDIALKVNAIAKKHDISLSRLALRYVFSIKEADRVVVGPTKKEQLIDLLNAWEEGKLPEAIFNEITAVILNSNTKQMKSTNLL